MRLYETTAVAELAQPHHDTINTLQREIAALEAEITTEKRKIKRIKRANDIEVNEFGQQVCDDYREDQFVGIDGSPLPDAYEESAAQDRLHFLMRDLGVPEPVHVSHGSVKVMAILALIDPDAPAKRPTSRTQLRDPDFIDDGICYWIGSEMVVSTPIEKVNHFASWVQVRGMVRPEGCFMVEPIDPEVEFEQSWYTIEATVAA